MDSNAIVSVRGVGKTYKTGFTALKNVDLEIRRGEIFALLDPNGAGKTTLINIICGVVNASSGTVTVDGFDNVKNYRETRTRIGLVPQELTTDMFELVKNTVALSRGIFGKKYDAALIEKILKSLSLWDKKDNRIMTLSGGMKRRVMMAKALSHEPAVLFLDEPTAGVDVALRRDMWDLVRELRRNGVTIILTTHYIEEAQEMADRIGVIHRGQIVVVEEKGELMRKLGKKQLTLSLSQRLDTIPQKIERAGLTLSQDKMQLIYSFDTKAEHPGIAELMKKLDECGIEFKDLQTEESSLEDIFVNLVKETV